MQIETNYMESAHWTEAVRFTSKIYFLDDFIVNRVAPDNAVHENKYGYTCTNSINSIKEALY